MIKENSIVTLHYTGTLADGTTFDSSEGAEPLSVELGKGNLIPGFEKELIGLAAGEKKTFTVPKEHAYEYHTDLIMKMPRATVPKDLALEEGAMLMLRAPNGQRVPGKVIAIGEDTLTVDLNIPVAGKDLTFAVEIVKVE